MARVWAVARLTLAEAIRTRLAIAFVVLLVGLMVLLVATATGDGTIAGKVQMFISYSMGVTHFLLSLLVAFLCCGMVDQDIKTRRIDSLVSKPIARWQFLFGRWLGVVLLAAGLLIVSLVATYVVVMAVFARQTPVNDEDKDKLDNQVLVARETFIPPLPDVSEYVEKQYQRAKQEGVFDRLDLAPSQVRRLIRDRLIAQTRTVPPRYGRRWVITGLPQPREGDVRVTVRYKCEPSQTTSGSPQYRLHSNTILGQWIIGKGQQAWRAPVVEKPYRTVHEIHVPLNCVQPDGTLMVTFINIDPRRVTVNFPLEDGLEVLVRAGAFTANFVRAGLIVFATLVFLATFATACSTFLSFPVASLVTLSVFFVGLAGNFLWEAIGFYGESPAELPFLEVIVRLFTQGTGWERVNNVITFAAMQLTPVLDVGGYAYQVADGRMIGWLQVGVQVAKLVVLEGVILGAFAVFVFNRRELGKVIV